MTVKKHTFQPNCLSIDLEVSVKTERIHQLAAVRGKTGEAFVQGRLNLYDAISQLNEFGKDVKFLLGHNIIAFDLPHLKSAKPDLELLNLPVVDTLQLNPLAFPANPYHHLVKHYHDGQLHKACLNDPELDARLCLKVYQEQWDALVQRHKEAPELLLIWHWLTTEKETFSGLNAFFSTIRHEERPKDSIAVKTIETYLQKQCCINATSILIKDIEKQRWSLAYAIAWLSVSGGNSVMPPWVRHKFPQAGAMIRQLRDIPCSDSHCEWCRNHHDPKKELKRWFGFEDFRPEPKDEQGRSLQAVIVESAMRGKHALGVLPTGTGKSLCYQIPALSRYEKTGALTLVISPLVALMSDQVSGLEKKGISSCTALNGLLSMPERSDVLDRVRLGDIAILLVSPEQLRSSTFRKVLNQREIGAWVLDEAHCISKWGHDFRPDYRYVGRFIKQWSDNNEHKVAPVLCLTATAKPDVIEDIRDHFLDKVGVELEVYDGGANRDNLDFQVIHTNKATKFNDIYQLLKTYLPPEQSGGAIVYCSTRKQTEDIAQFLIEKGLSADRFHAHLKPEMKKSVQDAFIHGDLRVIAATNAFGMGIDKSDVRLVIHADIPGSLENYLQEAGRAGRDRQTALCILLYDKEDVERQFSMSAKSRLTQREIASILRSLRRLEKKKKNDSELIVTSGEILVEEQEGIFVRDSNTDDTRVRTALLWLEESHLLTREQNQVKVFPSSLKVASVEQARKKLNKVDLFPDYREQLLKLIETLMDAEVDEGLSTDELMGFTGLNAEGVRKALYDLEHLGIASNDTALTAFVHHGVVRSSRKRFQASTALELALITLMREADPDLGKGDIAMLHLRETTQRLKDKGHSNALPEKILRLLRSLSMDGFNESGGQGSIELKRMDNQIIQIRLHREWSALEKTARIRSIGAEVLLEHLLKCLPENSRGNDQLAETTMGKLLLSLKEDVLFKTLDIRHPQKLIDYALLWLHEQEVIRLNKGLAVFRPAMTIKLSGQKRRFYKADFLPLQDHYKEQVLQIHVMAEYAQRALKTMVDAVRLTMDYFSMNQKEFVQHWLPGREKELTMQTTQKSWQAIVESLNNPIQQGIVTDDRDQTNVLVLAGPGSGKTKVLVHRIAYLVRVKRENPKGILALAYNRHAAAEIRKRLHELIDNDAQGVTVLTCHALAMRLVGASFSGRRTHEGDFNAILQQAVSLLKGDGLLPDEADEQRDRLLSGFRWILVDEYQDVAKLQYELIAAVAGRTLNDPDRKLTLFAVGDDDQNIYAFNGASIEYIRRFEQDYSARPLYLTENYRSTANIINASNQIIGLANERMKAVNPIEIDSARKHLPSGGEWEQCDPVTGGKVQILTTKTDKNEQAIAVINEIRRLFELKQKWDWCNTAVIAREWQYLEPVRSYCEMLNIPVQMAHDEPPPIWTLRETQQLIEWMNSRESSLITISEIQSWIKHFTGLWWDVLQELMALLLVETNESELPAKHLIQWLVDWGRDFRRQQKGLLLLTAHRAKGLEFDQVAVLDGGWEKTSQMEDKDANRRLYYVAMTRAKKALILVSMTKKQPFLSDLDDDMPYVQYKYIDQAMNNISLIRRYLTLSLKDVDIGFAGSFSSEHPVHKNIAMIQAGDEIKGKKENGSWLLLNDQDKPIGRLAKSFQSPKGLVLERIKVIAIIQRRKIDTASAYQDRVKCDTWEVILPEMIFNQFV